MAFILGVGSYSSDTCGPIWMKLWGCIELTLKLCIVTFLTSGLASETEVEISTMHNLKVNSIHPQSFI